jgi:hypothetical protein
LQGEKIGSSILPDGAVGSIYDSAREWTRLGL